MIHVASSLSPLTQAVLWVWYHPCEGHVLPAWNAQMFLVAPFMSIKTRLTAQTQPLLPIWNPCGWGYVYPNPQCQHSGTRTRMDVWLEEAAVSMQSLLSNELDCCLHTDEWNTCAGKTQASHGCIHKSSLPCCRSVLDSSHGMICMEVMISPCLYGLSPGVLVPCHNVKCAGILSKLACVYDYGRDINDCVQPPGFCGKLRY